MPIPDIAREFDAIAPVYDATRDPLDPETIVRLVSALSIRSVRSVLEIGVGTGRSARPLSDAGCVVTGLDASAGMLRRARAKGLDRLVRGSAYHLPFGNGVVDATLFVHVLHLLDDPAAAIREAVRVGCRGALALVHPAPWRSHPGIEDPSSEARRIVYRRLAAEGYPVPRTGGGPAAKERTLLAEFPPDDLAVVSDRMVTESMSKTLRMLERRASRHLLHVPPELLARVVTQAREEVGDRTVTYHRIEALATWFPRATGASEGGTERAPAGLMWDARVR